MPRASNGIYTLPVPPFVSGTIIKSADANSDFSDIATALTQSLASTGVTQMTGPIQGFAGSLTNPAYSFVGDANTGLYQVSPGIFAGVSDGTEVFEVDATNGITVEVGLKFTGTTYSFTNNAANTYLTALAENFILTFTIDGNGNLPTTGFKGYQIAPCNATIIQATIFADQSGSAAVDITKSSYAGFPPVSSICGGAPPTLTTQQKNQDSTLTGWTKTLTSGDVLGFNLTSVTTCTRVQVILLCTRTSR